ncbi:hypothetical protein ACWGI0_00235 [Streptomyces sp. NPDC054802]
MVATTHHVAGRTTSHHLLTTIRSGLAAWTLRHSRRAQAGYFERLRTSLPVLDPDRHALESPAVEDAFAHMAIAHPDKVTPADGGQAARSIDREQQLLAACDAWFREAHGPERAWPPATIAAYNRLLDDVHAVCRRNRGSAS